MRYLVALVLSHWAAMHLVAYGTVVYIGGRMESSFIFLDLCSIYSRGQRAVYWRAKLHKSQTLYYTQNYTKDGISFELEFIPIKFDSHNSWNLNLPEFLSLPSHNPTPKPIALLLFPTSLPISCDPVSEPWAQHLLMSPSDAHEFTAEIFFPFLTN